MLEGVFMAIELAEHCAQVKVSICESGWLVQFEFELKGLDEVGKGSSDLACSSIVASQVIVGGCLQLQRISGHQLSLFQIVQCQLKFLFVKMHHRCLVQVLAKLLRRSLKLGMIDPINIFFNAHYLFHDVDALYEFALNEHRRTFFWSTSHLDVSCVNFQRSSMSICRR